MRKVTRRGIQIGIPIILTLVGTTGFHYNKSESHPTNQPYYNPLELISFNNNENKKDVERYEIWKNALENVNQEDIDKYFNSIQNKNISSFKQSPLDKLAVEYCIPENQLLSIERILKNVKYTKKANPDYAGTLYDNNKVKIIEKKKDKIITVRGMASIYTSNECGNKTATGGEVLDNEFSAAVSEAYLSDGISLPALFYIKNLENGQGSYFVADNKGPYRFNSDGKAIYDKQGNPIPNYVRIVDLSPRLAEEIGIFGGYKNDKPIGRGKVEIRYIESLEDYVGKL